MAWHSDEVLARLDELRARDAEIGRTATESARANASEPVSEQGRFPCTDAYDKFTRRFEQPSFLSHRFLVVLRRRFRRRFPSLAARYRSSCRARSRRVAGFTAFIDRDVILSRGLRRLLKGIDAEVVYGDSVHHGNDGRSSYQLRPGWSPERLRAHAYVGEVILARREAVRRAGGARFLRRLSAHDRALRLTEMASRIERLPEIIYSGSFDSMVPSADLDAVIGHCGRTGIVADCVTGPGGTVRVNRRLAGRPSVNVIIPTKGATGTLGGTERPLVAAAVDSLLARSSYPNYCVTVVADIDTPSELLGQLSDAGGNRLKVVEYDRPFNFSEKINLGASVAEADFLLFMNDDVIVKSDDVLEVLLAHFDDPAVGLVSPLLIYEDGRVQSAGHLLNPRPFDLYRGFEMNCSAGFGILSVAREVSSVLAAFSMTPSSLFREAGGLSTQFPSDYNDVDYALKLSLLGRRSIVTPHVRCIHLESATRVPGLDPRSVELLLGRWSHVVDDDPYGNPGLQREECLWKSDVDTGWSLEDAVGYPVTWDRSEWSRLQEEPEPHLHRTRFFPKWLTRTAR